MSSGDQEASHAPTADRVFQIFHHSNLNPNSSELPSDAELPEIDFMDLGRIMNEIEDLEVEAASSKNATCTSTKNSEDQTTTSTIEQSFTGVRIDIKPSPVQDSPPPANHIPIERPDTNIVGKDAEDDDEIVYVAPNPRKGVHISSFIPPPSAAVPTILPLADSKPVFGQVLPGANDPPSATAFPAQPTLKRIPKPSPPISPPALTSGDLSNTVLSGSSKSAHRARRPRRVTNRRVKRHVTFGSFGAIRAEAALREVDPQWDEQRRGDSDVDWGGSASEGSLEDGGMLVDHDVDVYAMEAFVKGMSIARSAQVTADDLEDEARIRAEDEDEEISDGESEPESEGNVDQDDEELELAGDTRIVLMSDEDIAVEDDLVDSEDDGTSEEEGSPKGSFQARLERLRKRTQGRPIRDVLKNELDGDLGVEEEVSVIAQIQVMRPQSPNVFLMTDTFTTGIP